MGPGMSKIPEKDSYEGYLIISDGPGKSSKINRIAQIIVALDIGLPKLKSGRVIAKLAL
jgi:hypothetical protein